MKVIIDFDGTLTAEEQQAVPLAEKSLDTLASEIVGAPRDELAVAYRSTRERLLANPDRYWWEVNGLMASYCDEGAFILNTTTIQVMLRDDPGYAREVGEAFAEAKYDPIVDCSNYLFHRHTAELPPTFRPGAREVLDSLLAEPDRAPVILTNSLGDKVRRFMGALGLSGDVDVLGDTRQYEMDPAWERHFDDPEQGAVQTLPLPGGRHVDLRRPDYYRALVQSQREDPQIVVVADTYSLPGALPLVMGIPFCLLHTPYTPAWCAQVVEEHPLGRVLDRLADLPAVLDALDSLR